MNMDVNPNIIPACSIERGITGSRFQPVPARLFDSSFQDLSTPPDPHISGACSAQNPAQQYTLKSFKLEGSKGPKHGEFVLVRYERQTAVHVYVHVHVHVNVHTHACDQIGKYLEV